MQRTPRYRLGLKPDVTGAGSLIRNVRRNQILFMKTSDISKTPLVRKYGVRGAKLFARLWFPFLYVLLIAPTAALWAVAPELAAGWKRILFGFLVGGLTVLAASLLTRMRLGDLADIERLESEGQAI